MKDKSGTATSKELSQWKRRFKVFFYGTPITVTGFFIAQICATKGSFSTEFSSLENWKTFTETFNLPIGVFTAMAAITTLIGMYYRSLQLAHQLNKVEDQIEIANKQFKKSEEQFNLAQQQFALADRKENFMLYLEHKKQIKSIVDSNLSSLLDISKNVMREHKYVPGVEVHFQRLYEKLFCENSPSKVTHFELTTKKEICQFPVDLLKVKLEELLKKSVCDMSYKDLDDIVNIYAGIGFHFKFSTYDEYLNSGDTWLANFFVDLLRSTMTANTLGVVNSEECGVLQNLCLDIAFKVLDAQMPA